jgi:hypothetical protein
MFWRIICVRVDAAPLALQTSFDAIASQLEVTICAECSMLFDFAQITSRPGIIFSGSAMTNSQATTHPTRSASLERFKSIFDDYSQRRRFPKSPMT